MLTQHIGAYLCVLASVSGGSRVTLTEDGRSEYRIVIPGAASEPERKAADELRRFLWQVTGAELPIVTDDQPAASHEIVLGDSLRLRQTGVEVDWAKLGDDGFRILTRGDRLFIAGGGARGPANGVYTFLEDYLGCRWLSAEVSVIPRAGTVVVGPTDVTQVPALGFREVYYADAMDPNFAARSKLNGNASIMRDGRMIGEHHAGWDLWCHSFFTLVPPDSYFAAHPEYYGLVDGRREAQQLCLADPDVLRITVEALKQRWAAHPDTNYTSVSQNDWGGNCQCDACRAIDEREGTPMGSVLAFVNKVAAEFPDKTISTLSYQYTRRPPRALKPTDNVLIMLCSIECNRSKPISSDPANASFRGDVRGWSRLSGNLFIWDYVIQFSNLLDPFPNLRVLQPNVRFFVNHGAKGMFAQGNREYAGEFAELRAYVLAKLLWNPDCDVDRAIDEFLQGYYGAGWRPMREYIDLMHDALERSDAGLSIYGGPGDARTTYLTEPLVARYDALFGEAERLAQPDADAVRRIRVARMPLMFAKLELGYGTTAERTSLLRRFSLLAGEVGLQRLTEWGRTPEEFRADIQARLDKESAEPAQ